MKSPLLNGTRMYKHDVALVQNQIKNQGITPELQVALRKAKNRLSAHLTRTRQRTDHASLRAENASLRKWNRHLSSVIELLRQKIVYGDRDGLITPPPMKLNTDDEEVSCAQYNSSMEFYSLRPVEEQPTMEDIDDVSILEESTSSDCSGCDM